MNETPLTVIGRLTQDPELRFTPSGAAVANFTIASNARKFDKNTNEWKDEPAAFWRCAIWREAAENVAESLTRGMAVVATGFIKPNVFTDKETGKERRSIDFDVQSIGPDLRWATAKVTKAERKAAGGFGQQPAAAPEPAWGSQQQADPWAHPVQESRQQANSYDSPPF